MSTIWRTPAFFLISSSFYSSRMNGVAAMTEHIVFYGKGGTGKSTLISNISAALAESGFKVMQIGCDPKADSCGTLNGGFPVPTISNWLGGVETVSVMNAIYHGFKGVACVELGDPGNSASGASFTIRQLFDLIKQKGLFEVTKPDYTLYDISGEHSMATYHESLLQLGTPKVFAVTTADFMSLAAINKIFSTLERLGESQAPAPFGGLIPNAVNNAFEESFINDFAKYTQTRTLHMIPRSLMVKQCELYGKTVIEASPSSNQSHYYRHLAGQIVHRPGTTPTGHRPLAMTPDQLRSWARGWADRLYAMDNGLVTDGAAI